MKDIDIIHRLEDLELRTQNEKVYAEIEVLKDLAFMWQDFRVIQIINNKRNDTKNRTNTGQGQDIRER